MNRGLGRVTFAKTEEKSVLSRSECVQWPCGEREQERDKEAGANQCCQNAGSEEAGKVAGASWEFQRPPGHGREQQARGQALEPACLLGFEFPLYRLFAV